MTDRELLEKAAKAAGLSVTLWEGHSGIRCAIDDVRHGCMWTPLDDDGDAFRLMVNLNLTVRCYMGSAVAQSTVPGGPSVYIEEMDQSNPAAATRRAITRAAAAIQEAREAV